MLEQLPLSLQYLLPPQPVAGRTGGAGGVGGAEVLLPDDVVSAAAPQAQPARAQDETPEWPVTAHAPVSLHPCSPASLPEVGR